MTFSKEQQQHARKLFIEECRQKALGAACDADFISKQHDKLMGDYEKLKRECSWSGGSIAQLLVWRLPC
jgi:hypothetical protein